MKANKITYRVLLIAGFILVNGFILFGIAQILSYLNTGADKASMFHQDMVKENYYTPKVTWNDGTNEGRPMEQPTLQKIEQHYLDAWYTRAQSLQRKDTRGIEDVYTEQAKEHLTAIVEHNAAQKIRIESSSLNHTITLDFYSADGNMVVFTDNDVRTYSATYVDNIFQFDTTEIACYKIIMLLEDGFWRIRHQEKFKISKPQKQHAEISNFNPVIGLNYYPKGSPWDTFNESFSTEVLAADFKKINALGLKTIRIFIGYEDFGGATISEIKIERLIQLLDIAETNDLSVIVTLFDFYGDYAVLDWSRTQLHAQTIVSSIAHHKALHSWDIKNEPDLDFESRGKNRVTAWLKEMNHTIKEIDSIHPTTIGWSSASAATNLVNTLDYISFHHYQALEALPEAYKLLEEKSDKNIVLQEFGLSTYFGIWNIFGYSETDQFEYYETFFKMQKKDSQNYLFWTLYDFDEIPSSVAGIYPWRKNKQAYFGIINLEGNPKEAFELFKISE
ncbi:MAG: hypothetical protein ACI825_000043 [Planctomycetota bacterium]|uniref:glycosyl hydrolase family 5 n=1 Tax=Patiriisocius sp. Uisw_047 TaxID=3230969 RepID=UPI0039EAB636